jgi:hypothetical protein
MSRKEARRPGLVQLAAAGKITTAEGARALEMSLRQFRRLEARYRAEGVRGPVHRRRGSAVEAAAWRRVRLFPASTARTARSRAAAGRGGSRRPGVEGRPGQLRKSFDDLEDNAADLSDPNPLLD